MMGWYRRLLPREDRFFDLFDKHSETVVAAARALNDLLAGKDVEANGRLIFKLEDEADAITRDVEAVAAAHPGTRVEYKPAAVVLHTRGTDGDTARAAAAAAIQGPASRPGVHVVAGKSVVEMSVRSTTKGDALTRLVATETPAHVVYAGDDVTDEDAFAALARLAVTSTTIKVGAGETSAAYRVADPQQMVDVLGVLAAPDARQRHRGVRH